MRQVRFTGSSTMVEIIGRIVCFELIGTTTFVKSNPRPTQLKLSKSAHAKFVICDHTIDITYLPIQNGFMYLVAVIDWYSRYILAWDLSNTLEGYFCQVALREALRHGRPDIFNTDQGVQFTAEAFTAILAQSHIQISMAGRGRALDNIFIERFWRSLKYEDVYVNDYATVPDLWAGLERYFTLYNHHRLHQSLAYRTPAEVHFAQDPITYVT